MKKINVSTFKANCLGILRDLQKGNESIIVTNREQPIAELRAINKAPLERQLGALKDTMRITGDIMDSFSEEKWDALN